MITKQSLACNLGARTGFDTPNLFIVMAEKKFAFVVNQSEAHLIEPTSSAENIAREAIKLGKVDRRVNLQTESYQLYFMTISGFAPKV